MTPAQNKPGSPSSVWGPPDKRVSWQGLVGSNPTPGVKTFSVVGSVSMTGDFGPPNWVFHDGW